MTRVKLVLALLILILVGSASAAELGVNYYHETMMKNGHKYIERTTSQVGKDLDSIKSVAKYVKLYSNPYSTGNKEWAAQVAAIAKGKGLYTVIVMNTEDRTISYSSWQDYSNRVMANCEYYNGKANEFIVGNEISLHSSMSKADIKKKVETLITSCKTKFSGPVSYEAFWYEKDQWKGYTGKLYFNMYERLNSYTTNVKEMNTLFGSNAYIGEFGEDLYDESTSRDEAWQALELKKRIDVAKATRSPVIYIFAYKEPSYTGFGLVRMDDTKRPAWNILTGQSPSPTPPSPTPVTGVQGLPVSVSPSTTKLSDVTSGVCRTITYEAIKGQVCNKGGNTYELYLQSPKNSYKLCINNNCVGSNGGFARFTA